MRCPHGNIVGEQNPTVQFVIDECKREDEESDFLLQFYSACDCCDTLMHHDAVGVGYKVMDDGRTLCISCSISCTPIRRQNKTRR